MRSLIAGLNELTVVVNCIKEKIDKKNFIVLLEGDLASGKTTLVKEFVSSLDINDVATSPTFSLQSLYGEWVFHYDLYNVTIEEFLALGLFEELSRDGVHFVEWADDKLEKLLNSFGYKYILIKIKTKDDKREYICID